MFDSHPSQPTNAGTDDALQASLPDPLPSTPATNVSMPSDAPFSPPPPPADLSSPNPFFGHTSPPISDAPTEIIPTDALPTEVTPPVADEPAVAVSLGTDDTPSTKPSADDLVSLKQEALQQLTPLVSHLDQSPEEKFRTTMMMIQASDDQSLLKDAYEAAKLITDEKARAQALLDVVNEVNYFTQQNSN